MQNKIRKKRVPGGRLPYQVISYFDDLCAVWKLPVSVFKRPKFPQNPMECWLFKIRSQNPKVRQNPMVRLLFTSPLNISYEK